LDEFLDFKRAECPARTYQFYRDKQKSFREKFGPRPLIGADGVAYKRWLTTEKPWRKGKRSGAGFGPVCRSRTHRSKSSRAMRYNGRPKEDRLAAGSNPATT
jgi:hypothetical protein